MSDSRPIGVFDSGMGGLTVMRALMARLPGESFIYLGDTARLPYGTKSADTVRRYALQAADALAKSGVSVEVVDLRCLMPLDLPRVIGSVKKTGRLVVAEPGWRTFGAGAEIVAAVVETLGHLRSRPQRVAWPHSAVPTSARLEEQFYPTRQDIEKACRASIAET